ncbi:regulator of Ty1 Transposition [Recurvomyces mirabilis]|uniref:Regulator of Ty1 Transposition n=1 Tax=Recurvomyces mirabilis TaxID=574656 RepID=A0AAE0TMV9_9PEZI|nr:regulator of Ty1 Transposition [Recurvomyces mirabilis]KAK5160196.1 regulator of Ty1 Transposition [Recurvomyces mirabilis]
MADGEENAAGQLFEGVVAAFIPSDRLDEELVEEYSRIIVHGGGRHIALRTTDNKIPDLSAVTHIIATNIDFPQHNHAVEGGILVVKPSWVRQSQAKNKLVAARQHSPDPNQYFQDVVLTCADLPEGDKDAIIAGVMALGGLYSGTLNKLTTHIVTLDYDHPKCQLALKTKANCKSVLPHWFDDCLRLGKKINERPYVFPNPPYLQSTLPKPVNSDISHVEGATTSTPLAFPVPTPPSSPSDIRKNLNAFMSKTLRLSSDLELSPHIVSTLEGLINHGGGVLTNSIDNADIYIGQYRDGAEYIAASRARKEVANLSWLYNVINNNKYTNPLSKLLHYPIPRNGLPGFSNMKISISNYNGEARTYLENLIKYSGAEFTKTMKQDNTHLIAAHSKSEKYEAAQEWNLNIINHLWLEESYAKCCTQALSNQKYTHFPASTNLSEVCGQTILDLKNVERNFFPAPPPQSPQKAPRSPAALTKGRSSPRKSVPASSITATGSTPRRPPAVSAPTPIAEDAETEDEDDQEQETTNTARVSFSGVAPVDDMDEDDEEQPSTTKKSRGRPRKSAATPRRIDDEKENESPLITTSSRAAKVKAAANLHIAAPDMLLYQKEMKRKGGVTHGGRPSSRLEDFSSPVPEQPKKTKKRKSDEATYDVTAEGSDLSDGETQAPGLKAKKARTTSDAPPIMYRMMVTGDERWVGKPKQESDDRLKLRMLGVELTQDPLEVDILVAPAIKRTKKFVAALANAPLVVDSKYLDAALKQDKLVENPKLLQDRKMEDAMGLKLSEAIDRAKCNAHELLQGWSIFVSKDIPGGFDTYKDIIKVNGGEAYMYNGRTGLHIPKRPVGAGEEDGEEFDYAYLVSGASEAEVKLWKTFRSTAEKQNLRTRVVKSDWLLTTAIAQEFRWRREWEWDEAALTA